MDNTVRLWDVESGRELRRLTGLTAYVHGVAFSADGRRALTGGVDGTVALWDVQTGKELHRFPGHGAMVMDVALSPDGRFALSASRDGTARQWRVPELAKSAK